MAIDKILDIIKRKVLKGTHLPLSIKEIQAGYLSSPYFKYAYIIIQLHIIHQRPRIMIVYHMISEVIQNNLICIIRFHGVDIPIVFQWGCQ